MTSREKSEEDKGEILFIRCSDSLKRRYKVFSAKYGLNYEAALKRLLDLADSHPELVETDWG